MALFWYYKAIIVILNSLVIIHSIIKISKNSKKKEGSLLPLFVFFFLISFAYFTASEAFLTTKESSLSKQGSERDMFIYYEEERGGQEERISFVHGNYLVADSPPFFVQTQVLGTRAKERRDNIISYRVESGDNISIIADKFGISEDTIRWANDITGNTVKEGDELLILPVTGVMYYIERGDTIGEIASMHKTEAEGIIDFNEIKDERIIAGDRIIVPGGTPPPPPPPASVARPSSRAVQSSFINPVPGGRITQGVHHYNAVDIYQPCGHPVVAAASGRVIEVSIGTWAGGAGNFVKIDHGKVIAMYAHLEGVHVSRGEYVSQGRQIGTVGNTGRTIGRTGCHLHFDILSLRTRNPFAGFPVGSIP